MSTFGLFGKLVAVEGQRDMLANLLLEAASKLKEVEHCESYIVSLSEEDPNAVFVFEAWKDEQAHKASLSLEAIQQLIERAKPIIAGMERIQTLSPLGGKGI
ncbi:putative quinol monooxygenase [Bacillus alkalicellulosilyticus]|uniref:putative quinol monooxygenase n=1 Tax=Alkalihalobacterium alkalicellulosilyticum TaxID=1912214 RepID=UPI000997DC13|nr:putative quinol monooxygenase [Bacillus alkalicellulosilyticus]